MPVHAVAPMPHRRLAWRLVRLRARRRRQRLDRTLAAGVDPWTSGELMVRAAQLSSLGTRRELADAISDLIVIAHLPGPVAPTAPHADVCRAPIFNERETLAELAQRLHSAAPVSVQCVAVLATLLWHDSDALRDAERAADALREALERCREVLRPTRPAEA